MAKQSLNLPYLVLAGIVVVAIVAGFLVVRPQVEDLKATQSSLKETRVQLTERQNFLRALDQKKAQLQSQAAHVAELDVALPAEEEMPDVLRIINEGAQAAGVNVARVNNDSGSVQASAKAASRRGQQDSGSLPSNVVPLGISVKVTGSYQGLRMLLQYFEKAGRLIDVTTVNMQRSVDQGETISADLNLLFYRFELTNVTEE